jgi:hypothetical protein
MSKPNPKPEFPVCGCAGRGTPGQESYGLHYLIAAIDRMNGRPAISDVKPEPGEDDRQWVRQIPDRAVPA